MKDSFTIAPVPYGAEEEGTDMRPMAKNSTEMDEAIASIEAFRLAIHKNINLHNQILEELVGLENDILHPATAWIDALRRVGDIAQHLEAISTIGEEIFFPPLWVDAEEMHGAGPVLRFVLGQATGRCLPSSDKDPDP